jgi:hypothetical protein
MQASYAWRSGHPRGAGDDVVEVVHANLRDLKQGYQSFDMRTHPLWAVSIEPAGSCTVAGIREPQIFGLEVPKAKWHQTIFAKRGQRSPTTLTSS